MSLKKPPDTVGESPSRFEKYSFLRKFPTLFCLPRRHVGYTYFGTFEFANSIRWFFETTSFSIAGCGVLTVLCQAYKVSVIRVPWEC